MPEDDVMALRERVARLEERLTLLTRADTSARLPRTRPAFDTVYQAEATGYVSVFFAGGRTDVLQLLVGPEDPPGECICEANTRNGLNTYIGGIVREGEYWTVVARNGARSGFQCVFTPLF